MMRRFIFPDSYYVDKFNANNYCEIVIDNYYAMRINLKNIQNNDDFEMFNSMVDMEKHLAIITSFSAMTIESFCNYYLLIIWIIPITPNAGYNALTRFPNPI